MSKIEQMIFFATLHHSGQVDRGGRPYLFHVITVMAKLNSTDDELNQIAIGHDLLEDTDATVEMLRDFGFSERVIDGIVALTKVKGETYNAYKKRIKANKDAIIVKLADLEHNMDLSRLKKVTDGGIRRNKLYKEFHSELKTFWAKKRIMMAVENLRF